MNKHNLQTTRRSVIASAALTCATAVGLAACGSNTAEKKKQAAKSGTTLGASSDVPPGSAHIYPDAHVIVVSSDDGEFHGLSAVCTHAGCTVNDVVEDTVTCPCHGSIFSTTDGSVLQGPATEPLEKVAVRDDHGQLTIE